MRPWRWWPAPVAVTASFDHITHSDCMMKMPSTSKLAIPMRKGLPALVDGAACADPPQTSRFVALLRKVRAKMASNWLDACGKAYRHTTIVRAVDDLISFVLLTEYIRQRDCDAVLPLEDILSETRPLRPSSRL